MNTLTIIKKQIEKAAALHDAQIAMTTYRGVKFECKQGQESLRLMAPSAIAVTPIRSDRHGSITNCGINFPWLCCGHVITLR